ncbi:Methionine synthase [compost metagenome]
MVPYGLLLAGYNAQDCRLKRHEETMTYLSELQRRVLVYDGAMGTQVQAANLSPEDYGGKDGCTDILVLTRPDVIEGIHVRYLEAGADVIETNTFGGNRLKLEEYGLGDRLYELNHTAAQLARKAADRFSTPEKPRFVAGSIGPTGMLPSSDDPMLSAITYDQLEVMFHEQAQALVEGGCDVLLIETSQDILEVKAAIAGIHRYLAEAGRVKQVALQVQVTLDVSGRMLLGTDMGAAIATLEALPIDVIGLNCSTGPEHMREPVRILSERATRPISIIPNAGLPLNVNGQAVYPLGAEPMAEALAEFVEKFGVGVVGGCCGTSPDHIRAIVSRVSGLAPLDSRIRGNDGVGRGDDGPYVSSAMTATALHQEPKPLIVGERVNAQGSRKMKQALLADDYDTVLAVAREQVDGGAHVLDVCVALTERADEAEQMRKVVKKLAMGIEAPLMIDSTEAGVIEAALSTYPGRAIINSINLENGRARIDALAPLAAKHGAALVALTIDEEGMAKTVERKVAIAKRIHEIVVGEYGLPPEALIFDDLTFTLATGDAEFRPSAEATIEGIRAIKRELPSVLTVLGVSNVSFGLAPHARAVLNSVFLYHCVQAGLDLAIVNPSHVTPIAEIPAEQRELAEDMVFNRREDALARFIDYFEAHKAEAKSGAPTEDPTAGMTAEEKIHYQILHRKKEGVEALIDEALTRQSPVDVLNKVLLPAMKDVGDKFGAGELILPFVLQSAEVMKKAVAYVENFLEKKEGYTKGKVVLATVYGDVHDIGKNLVNTILTNNGYTVYDLGKQVPINTILEKAEEVGADAIGLSALLVSTSKQMPAAVQELAKRSLKYPVIIGGAAINRSFGRRINFLDEATIYGPGVFYANDAFEGLAIMDALTSERREDFVATIHAEARKAREREKNQAPAAPSSGTVARSDVRTDVEIPKPPFWGTRVLKDIPLDDIWPCLDLKSLFRLSWGARDANGEKWVALLRDEFNPRLERMKQQFGAPNAEGERILDPKVIYGYFPCQSESESLIVYDPQDQRKELTRFQFPRQPDGERLCLADYFASKDSGRMDVVALQAVTVGPGSTTENERMQAAGDYSEAYYLHGLSVEAAEALAEYSHRHIKQELGLDERAAPERGKRYSWGYPAIPDLEDHEKVFQVLPISESLGMTLTESFQLVPEQSTLAIVLHHPEAKYYAIRAARGERVSAHPRLKT